MIVQSPATLLDLKAAIHGPEVCHRPAGWPLCVKPVPERTSYSPIGHAQGYRLTELRPSGALRSHVQCHAASCSRMCMCVCVLVSIRNTNHPRHNDPKTQPKTQLFMKSVFNVAAWEQTHPPKNTTRKRDASTLKGAACKNCRMLFLRNIMSRLDRFFICMFCSALRQVLPNQHLRTSEFTARCPDRR